MRIAAVIVAIFIAVAVTIYFLTFKTDSRSYLLVRVMEKSKFTKEWFPDSVDNGTITGIGIVNYRKIFMREGSQTWALWCVIENFNGQPGETFSIKEYIYWTGIHPNGYVGNSSSPAIVRPHHNLEGKVLSSSPEGVTVEIMTNESDSESYLKGVHVFKYSNKKQ